MRNYPEGRPEYSFRILDVVNFAFGSSLSLTNKVHQQPEIKVYASVEFGYTKSTIRRVELLL
jgi:hypothetical protein